MISTPVLWYQGLLDRKLAIAGGGTAGHVTTGLAIMEAYRKTYDNVEVYFIGCHGGFESRMVPARGFELHTIPGAPYARQGPVGKARSVVELLRGVLYARRLLRSTGTKLVVGLGGYASAGAILAARSLGIPILIHEANASPGLANRLVGRLADRVCVGWKGAYTGTSRTPVSVTGNPILNEIVAAGGSHRNDAGPKNIFVTGGSEGSPFLNDNAPALLAAIAKEGIALTVRHQTGPGNCERVRLGYQKAGISARVEDFVEDMGAAYGEAHFAIASAGALTLAELAAAGVPALILPTKAVAYGHQDANAIAYAAHTGNVWIAEQDWNTAELADKVAALLQSPAALLDQAHRARTLARPDAADQVVAACEELMDGRW